MSGYGCEKFSTTWHYVKYVSKPAMLKQTTTVKHFRTSLHPKLTTVTHIRSFSISNRPQSAQSKIVLAALAALAALNVMATLAALDALTRWRVAHRGAICFEML